ncbi:MAG: hypothetical protein K6E91_06730 [Butyrivibrio sp.]|nr:hypothetical protein [Butyrivibrio sp.]
MTGIDTIEQIVQHKRDTRDGIKRMLGDAFADTDRSILDEVLRREAGIVSTDYLTDLARVFMSINTHVFMKDAVTDKEKALGTVIAQNLFNNSNYVFDNDNPTGHLEEVKSKDIMEAFGVKDNYHIILKHSLA